MDEILRVIDQHRQAYAQKRDELIGKANAGLYVNLMAVCDSIEKGIKELKQTPVELGPDGKEWAKTSAGFDHVEAIKHRADGWHGLAPWFHGWAVREAFVAGAEWQEKRRG